jgi:hypothetical protein
MLTLLNPLDKFQSYAIHHVIVACRTTQEAKDFTDESKNTPTLDAINQVKQLGEVVPYGNKDTAFLVVDTRRFSQFTVENMKYEVLINGLEKAGAPANLATSMTMTITDAVGISFINFLQWLMNEKMQTNFDGMIFMHRVIFIGHNVDGTTEVVQSVTIPMHLFNVELNLDYAKGAYTIEFMPNMNFDVSKHDRWLNISSASRFFTGKGTNSLGDMVNNFETQLNTASSDYFNKAQQLLQTAGKTTTAKKFGRLVKYLITIPKEWEKFTFTGSGTANATETVFAKQIKAKIASKKPVEPAKVGTAKDTHLSVEPGLQITEVLDIMFGQVQAIADLGAGRKTTNSVVFYKHMVGITSDDESVVVHVDVVQFEVPNIVPTEKVGQSTDQFYTQLEDGSRVPKDFMEFDYIFTGKNKDILAFDMKMQNLTWLLASNLNLGPGAMGMDENVVEGKPPADVDKKAELVSARAYDALLLPRNTADELTNFGKYTSLLTATKDKESIAAAQDYTRNLSMFYAMSPVTCIMTIRGNPLIMAKFNQSSFLEHVSATSADTKGGTSSTNNEAKSQYRSNFEAKILKDNMRTDSSGGKIQEIVKEGGTFKVVNTLGKSNYSTAPVFVKINIKGPKVDFTSGAAIMGGDFAETLLQNNFYTVFKVTNKIEGHVFTQDLELYSHNIFGMDKISGPAPTRLK